MAYLCARHGRRWPESKPHAAELFFFFFFFSYPVAPPFCFMTVTVDFSRYQGFIFDLDGTLIDSMPFHIRAWQQVANEHGFAITPDFIYERGGFSSRNIIRDMAKEGNDVGSVEDFVARKVQLYREHIQEVPLFPEVFQILKEAHERGAKTAIGSGTQRKNVVDILAIHHIEHMVDVIVSADDVTEHKPRPETFLQAMRLMGVTPEQTLVVEDGKPGIQAASAAHADCLIVDRGSFVELVKA